MSRSSPRTSSKFFDQICKLATCAKVYTAQRVTAEYCSDACRVQNHRVSAPPTLRAQVLNLHGPFCDCCGSEKGKMFVWLAVDVPQTPERAHLLCGKCHATMIDPERLVRRALWKEARAYQRAHNIKN